MPITDDDIREILRIIDESPLAELRIETEEFSLHVVKGPRRDVARGAPARAREVTETARALGPPEPAQAARTPEPTSGADGLVTIDAPMLGTFYRAEGPGQPPFVDVGSGVEPDTIVCIIEVMKMMNSVAAGVSGTVVEVLGENAQLVEYGQPLFKVQPA